MTDPKSSDTPTPPALTPLDWANFQEGHEVGGRRFGAELGGGILSLLAYHGHADGPAELEAGDRHALAALCLYQQPWGFSSEDVKLLRRAAIATAYSVLSASPPSPNEDAVLAEAQSLLSLASRIASLLPPDPAP